LPDSTQSFFDAKYLAKEIERAGFGKIRYRRKMGGAVAIHSAERVVDDAEFPADTPVSSDLT
jgi:ubiquinone/menaquinone biosynthesis C-methylase UbiE